MKTRIFFRMMMLSWFCISLNVQAAIMRHPETLNTGENNRVIIAAVSMCRLLNVCKSATPNNALPEYARSAENPVRAMK
jgi:hypothetical protein